MNLVEKIKNYLDNLKTQTKTVYRYSSQEEVALLQYKQTEGLGKERNRTGANTHRYKAGEKYLHFFESKDLPSHITYLLPGIKDYICSFNVPLTVLKKHRGIGKYNPQGYDVDVIDLVEYAIPVSEFKPEWFIDATLIAKNKTDNNQNNATSSTKTRK